MDDDDSRAGAVAGLLLGLLVGAVAAFLALRGLDATAPTSSGALLLAALAAAAGPAFVAFRRVRSSFRVAYVLGVLVAVAAFLVVIVNALKQLS